MKNFILLFSILFSTISFAGLGEPTMTCKMGEKREIKIYGPLGYFYQNDIKNTSEISFPNKIELIFNKEVVHTLSNSTSMVNDKSEYTIMAYVLAVKDLTLIKVLNIFYRSEKGQIAHIDINIDKFNYRGRGFCELVR